MILNEKLRKTVMNNNISFNIFIKKKWGPSYLKVLSLKNNVRVKLRLISKCIYSFTDSI